MSAPTRPNRYDFTRQLNHERQEQRIGRIVGEAQAALAAPDISDFEADLIADRMEADLRKLLGGDVNWRDRK